MNRMILNILTFNVLHGATMNNDGDLDVIASVIRESAPDLVALQELDVRTGRVAGADLATEIGFRTGLNPLFARAMYYDGGEYGIGILSRFSYRETRAVALPSTTGNEPRTALGASVDLPGGTTIEFIATHLDNVSAEDRVAQARTINQTFGCTDRPRILAGDFNATPDSETLDILRACWTPSDGLDAPPTFPSSKPEIKIDYIFYGPPAQWRVLSTGVIQNTVASDHFAFQTVLELVQAP